MSHLESVINLAPLKSNCTVKLMQEKS